MNIGAVAFGGLCTLALIIGIFYIAGVTHNSPTITDTYGNSLNNASSNISVVASTATTGTESNIVWLILIIAGIVVCAAVAGAYASSRIIT